MSSRILKMFFGMFALLAVHACGETDKCEPGVYSKTCRPPGGHYTNKLVEGKRFLSEFEGQRARDVFKLIDAEYRLYNDNKPHCEATYGVVLADAQVAIKNLNGLVFRFLTNSIAGAPAGGTGKKSLKGDYSAAALPQDLGVFIQNGWNSFEPVLAEMSVYAETVTAIPKCTFSIGAGDPAEVYDKSQENPFKFVLNIGDSDVPVVQMVLTGRFDGSEARLMNSLVRSILGSMDFILAHDYSMTFNLTKILHLLGLPSQCIRENILKCVAQLNGEEEKTPMNLLGASFFFADNPKLLDKSPTRWDQRFYYIDNEFAGAFFGMRTFFDSLVARSQALAVKSASDDELNQYIIIYKDGNENGIVDADDDLGINITAIKLSPEFFISQSGMESNEAGREKAKELRQQFSDAETAIETVLNLLRGGAFQLTEGSVAEIDLFFDRFYSNMRAVDVPETTAERIPIDSFNTLVQDFLLGIFDSTPTPNFMEFDVRSYFVNAKSLRKYLPYWEMTLDKTVFVGSQFLADSDDYAHTTTQFTTVTLPQVYFDQVTGGMFWAPETKLYVPASVNERGLLNGVYDGGDEFGVLSGIGSASDCINANNVYSEVEKITLNWPVMMLGLQDPSINGVIYTDLGAWTSVYNPAGGNGTAGSCSNPAGFLPASNYSLTKSMWMYVDFLVDHFTLTQVLVEIGLVK